VYHVDDPLAIQTTHLGNAAAAGAVAATMAEFKICNLLYLSAIVLKCLMVRHMKTDQCILRSRKDSRDLFSRSIKLHIATCVCYLRLSRDATLGTN
jgi:hypothetical protein